MLNLVAFGVVGCAAVDRFGWLYGIGITCAVWLLTPYQYNVKQK